MLHFKLQKNLHSRAFTFYVKALRHIRTIRDRCLNTTSYKNLQFCLNLCSDLTLVLPRRLFVHLIAEQSYFGLQRGNKRGPSGECSLLKDRMNIRRKIKRLVWAKKRLWEKARQLSPVMFELCPEMLSLE